ncbi:hypothetical protein H8D29_02640 [PVC group bacterium]|nr:hypothetical protein [PVC group bacterium]
MKMFISILTALLFLNCCSSSTDIHATTIATRVVNQISDKSIRQRSIASLTSSFLESGSECKYNDAVVDITGEVVAYGLVDGGVYTITIRQDEMDALCLFDESISDQLGGGRLVSSGATIMIRGQCQSSGLFATHPFSLNGCKVISE